MEDEKECRGRLLIVDDEPYIINAITRLLRGENLELLAAENGAKAIAVLEERMIDVILLDVKLPDISGLDVLRQARQMDPEIVIVIMSGHGTIKMAVEAMKEGAFEFISKPFETNDLIPLTVNRALEFKKLHEENRQLHGMVSGQVEFSNMVGVSAPMQRLLRLIPRLADIESTVLITGESGTGKEVFARAIHFSGNRRHQRFIPVDCGAMPEGVIENELFGHQKGAFTGADQAAHGLIKMADKGTIFFDEVAELPLSMQTRLLRFLQEHEVRSLGGTATDKVDTRVIAATNKNLEQMVAEKRFREDLYYRLNVVSVEMPPLRKRSEDIPVLIRFFMDKYRAKFNRKISLRPEVFEQMLCYSWPGNVRELENVIIKILSVCPDDTVGIEELPSNIRETPAAPSEPVPEGIELTLPAYEKLAIERALARCQGNIIEAAKILNLGKSTLYRKIKDLGVDVKSIC